RECMRPRFVYGTLAVVTAAALAAAPALWSQPPRPPDVWQQFTRLRNEQPPFLVRATVNHESHDYREGDPLKVSVASEEDAYLYVLHRTVDGKSELIFPNQFQPDNHVKARQAVQVPGDDDWFSWVIAGPTFGEEAIKVIASKKPVQELADPSLRA